MIAVLVLEAGLASATFGACGYDAHFSDCTVSCASTACPEGFTCGNEGLCRLPGRSSACATVLGDATATAPPFAFSAGMEFPTGATPGTVAIADVNRDGRPDIATANYDGTSLSILLNTTPVDATTPSFSAKTDFATSSGPWAVSVGDVNGDGVPDVVVAQRISNTISASLNTTTAGATTPSFAAKIDFATGSGVPSVAVADINEDGKPDLVVLNQTSSTISILINTTAMGAATPSFATKVDLVTDNAGYLAVGDINGDAKEDIVATNYAASTVSIFLNVTASGAAMPAFASSVDFPSGTGPSTVAIGDVNGDGKLDIVTGDYGAATVSVLLNTTSVGATSPEFAAKADFATASGNPFVAIGDLNGDGRPDLAIVHGQSNMVSLLANTAPAGGMTLAFATSADLPTGKGPSCVAIDDLNGDGKPDIAVTNGTSSTVSVFLSK